MTTPLSREEALGSYLIGEQARAERDGRPWDRERATERFEAFLSAERFDALGVTDATVALGASVLLNHTRIGWDNATPEQRASWKKGVRAALVAIRDFKRRSTSTRKHGTRAKYIKDGCLCPDCTEANTQYLQDLKARKKAGNAPMIPAGRSQATLRALVAVGMSVEDIANGIGLAHSSTQDIFVGHAKRVRPETEKKIIKFSRATRPRVGGDVPRAGAGVMIGSR